MDLELSKYERDNLKQLLDLVMSEPPFNTMNTGDWVGQIHFKLGKGDGNPNVPKDRVLENAYHWRNASPLTEQERTSLDWAKEFSKAVEKLDFDEPDTLLRLGWKIKHLRNTLEKLKN